jgi:hypothetical protein
VGSKAQRHALVDLWVKEMGALLGGASGGAHSADVLTNERDELAGHAKGSRRRRTASAARTSATPSCG